MSLAALTDTRRSTLVALAMASTVTVSWVTVATAADDDDNNTSGWSERITDSVKNTMSGMTKKLGLDRPPGPAPSESPSGCPTIALLPGTEAQRVLASGANGNLGVRYQYSLTNVGRECAFYANSMTIKVGADGRVLLGPAGTAGHFDVPIRVAVFSETQQKAVESKLFRVPVSIPAGQSAAPFAFVSDRITLAVPKSHGNEYSIKVGIDAGGAGAADPHKPRHAHHRKAAASQEANGSPPSAN